MSRATLQERYYRSTVDMWYSSTIVLDEELANEPLKFGKPSEANVGLEIMRRNFLTKQTTPFLRLAKRGQKVRKEVKIATLER